MIKVAKIFLLFLLFLVACQSDVALIDKSETRVVVDSFIQTSEIEKLDILVSVDTSGSMYDNFEDVGTGMELLRADIESLTLDYRFGFITADSNNLSYVGPYDSTSSAIDMILAPSLLSPTSGEAGFASTYAFYADEISKDFFRNDSDFLLFLISDEDEQSTISAVLFEEWMADTFYNVRQDVVAVTTLENNLCGYSYDVGYKYIELSSLYEKSAVDICSENWSVWLSESSFLTRLITSIQLSEKPVIDSIIVYLDGNITYNWEYDSSVNVVFLQFVPDYNQLIEVGYNVEVE